MTKKLDILDSKGAVTGEFTFEDNCLEFEKGEQAVHDVVVAIRAGERAGTACTKTRTERRGGGAKPFKQKGLGRARSGSVRNPIWRGGGVIFGPKPRSFAKKINKKVRKLAIKRAFSDRLVNDSILLIDEMKFADHKTKNVQSVLDNLKINNNTVLLVVNEESENAVRATGNMADLVMVKASVLNVYMLLRFKKVLFTKDALDTFVQQRLV